MRKILIFGNSGSGKSTLAKRLCEMEGLKHLDLDVLAWQQTIPPKRKPLEESSREINTFIDSCDGWVIEGCYTDLLEVAVPHSNEMIFLNLPISVCISNAKNRPWEPHKYDSKEAQDANLEMLVDWISEYETRVDTFSRKSHLALYQAFGGVKTMYTDNNRSVE